MVKEISVGDNVRLLALSNAFLKGLPADEQSYLLSLIGEVFVVKSIELGLYWFDSNPVEATTESGVSYWTDNSFSVERHELDYIGSASDHGARGT